MIKLTKTIFTFSALIGLMMTMEVQAGSTSTISGGGAAGYIVPQGCYKPGFTCVLKVDLGGAFFCQKSTKQRIKNSKNQPRRVMQMKCAARYPALRPDNKQGE